MSFPKYPAYKESGVEWIGKIPAGWGVAPLFSISTENREKNTGLKSSNTLSLSYGNIIERDKNNNFGLLPDSYETYQIVKFGDIIFRLTDLQNDKNSLRSAISRYNGIITSAYLSIKTSKNCCPFYISYLMRAYDCEKVFYSMGGGVRQSLNFKEFKYLPVILPPLPEQQAIARFLDQECGKIDALIAEQERLIALLAEKRQAVISHAVTKGLNPNAPMKDSGIPWIGMVPEGWEVHPLKNVASVQTGIAKGKEVIEQKSVQIPYLRVANVQDGYLDLSEVSRINIDRDQVERYLLRQGDVLMNEGGDFDKLGRGAIWHGEISPCIHQNHVFAVRPKSIMSEWISAVIGSDYAKFYFMTRSKQSTNLASISSTNLMLLPIILPSIDDQKNLVKFLENKKSQFENLMNSANSIITLLKERRAALISAAVTGKIDVRAQSKALAA